MSIAKTKSAEYPHGKRGFAAMSSAQVKAIAARGGIMAHLRGTAHRWTVEEARIAGRKGGAGNRRRWRKAQEVA